MSSFKLFITFLFCEVLPGGNSNLLTFYCVSDIFSPKKFQVFVPDYFFKFEIPENIFSEKNCNLLCSKIETKDFKALAIITIQIKKTSFIIEQL